MTETWSCTPQAAKLSGALVPTEVSIPHIKVQVKFVGDEFIRLVFYAFDHDNHLLLLWTT